MTTTLEAPERRIDIPTLLPWSEPKRVNTRNGPRDLRTAAPSEAFWDAWREAKFELSQAGISVSKDRQNGQWAVCWWGQVPTEETQVKRALIDASRATERTDVVIPKPEDLDYLGYQRAGIAFAMELYRAGKGGCLIGDEMGLGKTIQAIGVVNADPSIKRVIVVCPATLKVNWSREMQKWLVRPMSIAIASGSKFPVADIAICNYDIIHRFPEKLSQEWDLVICDEIHLCKNAKTIRARALFGCKPSKKDIQAGVESSKGVNARRKLALTGTPICNKTMELFPILNWLDPVKWNNGFQFGIRYAGGKQIRVPWMEKGKVKRDAFGKAMYRTVWEFSGASNLDELQQELRTSCMVRRLKADVLKELPPKRRQIIEIPAEDCQDLIDEELEGYQRHEARLVSLKARVELAKVSDNPAEYAEAVKALGEGTVAAFTEGALIAHKIAVAKVPYVIEHVKEAIQDGQKVIVFAHHKDVVHLLAAAFPGCAVVTGEVDSTIRIDENGRETSKRMQQADKFQKDPNCLVFIGNIKAAGVGLTLTASAHVVFAEEDWVPGNMSQCEDRAHRIGQKNSVLVQHIVLEGSLDVYKCNTILDKQAIIDQALDNPLVLQEAGEAVVPITSVSVKAGGERAGKPAVGVTRKEADELAPRLTREQMEAIHRGLQTIAGKCDGAHQRDDNGFSGCDVAIGHSLANQSSLSPRQAVLGQKLVRKYQRQLSLDLVERAGVTPKSKKGKSDESEA